MAVAGDIEIRHSQALAKGGVTLRSVLLGLLTAGLVAFYGNVQSIVLHGGSLVKSSYPVALILYFCVDSDQYGARHSKKGVDAHADRDDGHFATTWIASMMPSVGWMGYLIGILPAPYFFATPENRWAELFFDCRCGGGSRAPSPSLARGIVCRASSIGSGRTRND